MTYYECDKTMKCLGLMCADLNDAHNDYTLETRKDKKIHCIALETRGTPACFTCPHSDCRCTAPCTKQEREYNDAMYTVLNDTYNRRFKK